ncbi:50S ribosomal protein L15 [uncultured Rikenella sp.]|uniref:50S ribosomal protein L15 n=1 Tax=uncultured Rikenella sp. TaxID=368003 RepID=UPI0025FE656A|nr:50S ribosomal protein L15 [uncultured Rikenella sp.]
MNLSNIKPAKGSTHSEKRIGRGQGSGYGGTSTRGHKGAQSRSGYKSKRGFQGGQMPLQRRLPKFGFTNINKVVFKTVNLGAIEALVAKTGATAIGQAELVAAGLVSKNDVVKILGTGTLTKKVDVTANAFSKTAQAAIEGQGGTVTKL